MKKMKKAGKSALSALLSASILISSIPVGTVTANAEDATSHCTLSAVDFTSLTYSKWDGATYDFSWYEGNTTGEYHITSAAQFAALQVLTNDLTKGWASYASALPDNCDPYLAGFDNFEGDTIYLDCNVDLAGKAFLPISYVFDTPNITYEDYPALDHVPAYLSSVDPWVGDGNGNEIITRYLELRESEMRYRDLLYGVNFDHKIFDIQSTGKTTTFAQAVDTLYNFDTGVVMYDRDNGQSYNLVDNKIIIGPSQKFEYVQGVNPTDYEIVASYTYADVYDYADNKGFAGTFDGQGNSVQNFYVWDVGWESSVYNRPYVFDPIGRGLFSILDKEGIIRNLNLKADAYGAFSYSALLCAYNYGLIENCYIYGFISAQQVKSCFPASRIYGEYAEDGTIITPTTYTIPSIYSGAVMPVGNSGMCTAWNCGTIKNCLTAGTITNVYRQFGVFACTNKGTVIDCTNTANCNSLLRNFQSTAFMSDEFSYTNMPLTKKIQYGPSYTLNQQENILTIDTSALDAAYLASHDAVVDAADSAFYDSYPGRSTQSDLYDLYEWSRVRYVGTLEQILAPYTMTAAAVQGYDASNKPWVPYMLNQKVGQSLAANHIYGVYGLTAIAGICVNNYGSLIRCTNEGIIYAINGTSSRGNIKTIYTEENPWELPAVNNSYIRPTSPFGLFSTQDQTYAFASGVCIYNYGSIKGCINTGNIFEFTPDLNTHGAVRTTHEFNPIMFAYNGFYRNDCLVYDDYANPSEYVYNASAYRWWVSGSQYATAEYDYIYNIYGSFFNQYEDGNYTDPTGNTWVNPYEDDEIVGKVEYKFLPVIENMPYPVLKVPSTYEDEARASSGTYSTVSRGPSVIAYTKDTSASSDYPHFYATATVRMLTAGLAVYNLGEISAYTDEDGNVYRNFVSGQMGCAVCYYSIGLDDKVALIDSVDIKNVTGLDYAVASKTVDTSITNITSDIGLDGVYGIVPLFESLNDKATIIENITIINADGAFDEIKVGSQRMPVRNCVNYTPATSYGTVGAFSEIAYNCDFDKLFVFNKCKTTLGQIYTCNASNIYVYGNVTESGLANGSVMDYLTNFHYCGYGAKYAVGKVTGGTCTDIYVNTVRPDGSLNAVVGVLQASNSELHNIHIFTLATRDVLRCSNCTVSDVLAYVDTPHLTSESGNIFSFTNCKVDTALLQSNVDIEWAGYNSAQRLPGVLLTGVDNNDFKNVVVQTPNGAVSYSTYAFALEEDTAVKTDAKMIYDPDARTTGALAYWMDHGDKSDRTFNYTVAIGDTYEKHDEITDAFVDWTLTPEGEPPSVVLPTYTRKRISEDEPYYYRVSAPYTSRGAGELVLRYNTQATEALGQMFPATNIYLPSGENFTLEVNEAPGYGILSITKSTKSLGEGLESIVKKPNVAHYGPVTEDVEFNSTWTETFDIFVEDNEYATITPAAAGSVPYEHIDVGVLLNTDDVEIRELYYYNHVKNSDNDWVVDTSSKVSIPLSTMSFEMPANPVTVCCTTMASKSSITSFRLGGVNGVVNEDNKSITLHFEDSIDLTSVTPEVFDVSGAKSIVPAIDVPQDFSKPVQYSITAENGDVSIYTVIAYAKKDGFITYFDLNGYTATIDNENLTIDLFLPIQLNLKFANPTILWSGTSIIPSGTVDLSSMTGEYTVTASDGVERTYTVHVSYPEEGKEISLVKGILPNGSNVMFHIDEESGLISAEVPYGTDTSSVVITDYNYAGLSSNLAEGDILNLSKSNLVVVQNITGETSRYRLYVKEAPDTKKEIIQFSLYGHDGVIDEEQREITVSIPAKYNLVRIPPDVITFTGKCLSNIYEKQDWTIPVQYTVTAYDGSETTYTVRVIQI